MAQRGNRVSSLGDTTLVPVDLMEPITDAFDRYQSTQSLGDLDELIELWRVVRALAETENLKSRALLKLSIGLTERHELTGDDKDLDERIDTMRLLVEFPGSQSRIDRARCAAMLGHLLLYRHNLRHNVEDLDPSIAALRQARELDPGERTHVEDLIGALRARARASGQRSDLDEVIELTSRNLVSDDPQYWDWPVSLEEAYRPRLDVLNPTGDAGIDDSLDIIRKLSPTGVSEESVLFRGVAHEARFYRYGESSYLERAIEDYASELKRGPAEIKEEIFLLKSLSGCYRHRYVGGSHEAGTDDIDKAITLLGEAIQLAVLLEAPPGYSRGLSQTLASYYTARFYRGPSHVIDLDKAIDIYRSTKVPNAVDPAWYMDYGQCLQCRLQIHRDSAAMDEMISVFEEGARCVPEQHSQRPYILVGLASARMQAFLFDASRPGFRFVPSRAEEVLRTYVAAANAADDVVGELYATRAFSRFYAQCHTLMPSLDWAQGFVDPSVVKKMQSRFLDRLSETMWLGHTVSRRYQEAAVHQSDVGATVANALLLQDHVAALECFEQGRAVVWSQIQNLRTPLDDLREKYPDLAETLEKLSLELEKAGRRAPLPLEGPSDILPWGHTAPVEEEAEAGRRLAREHKALLEHIRSLEGFDTFLRPKGADALLKAAKTRAVACINVHASRCDALIIFDSNMHHVHLDQLTPAKIDGWHVKLTSFLQQERARAIENPRKSIAVQHHQRFDDIQGLLQEMWYFVVWPILAVYLDKLEHVHGRAHITWCTSGQLAFLPLHAAGPYNGRSLNAPDLVVSSYAPNLSSLLPQTTEPQPAKTSSILVVARSKAPKLSPLLWTAEESTKVASHFSTGSRSAQVLLDEAATVDAALFHMANYPYIHLACHGGQADDPMNSAFFLDSELTLKDLMKHKSSNAQLAFLSACETATGDKSVPNEAVHLAAGMLAAGYESVVATMWSIGDMEAPSVADEFYKAFLPAPDPEATADPKPDPDPESVPWPDAEGNAAIALHWAVHRLRKQVGDHEFVKWMPYIHLGQ